MKYIYISNAGDALFERDQQRLQEIGDVTCITLSDSIRGTVHFLTQFGVRALIVPDEVDRHTRPVERVKQCAHCCAIPVHSVSLLLGKLQTAQTPTPQLAPVRAGTLNGVGASASPG